MSSGASSRKTLWPVVTFMSQNDKLARSPVAADPGLVVVLLVGAGPAARGAGGDLAGPLPVRAVQPGRAGRARATVAPIRTSGSA